MLWDVEVMDRLTFHRSNDTTWKPNSCSCCSQIAIYSYTTKCNHRLCGSCYAKSRMKLCPVECCTIEDIGEVKQQMMSEVACIIPHVFLLLNLRNDSNLDTAAIETCLLQTFNNFLAAQQSFGHPFLNALEAFDAWSKVQDTSDEEILSQVISCLKADKSLPVYIRAQNAGLIITVSNASCLCGHRSGAVVSTFAASQKSADINSAPGDLIASYPMKSIHVPCSQLLSSATLARQIISLNKNTLSEAMTKVKKSYHYYDEERDVADPVFVSKWLCGSLCTTDSCLCTAFPQIVKKIRDIVIYQRESMPTRRSGIWMTMKVVLHILLVKQLGPVVGRQLYKLILLKFMCTLCWVKSIDADTGVQIMTKIARRLYKLYNVETIEDSTNRQLLDDLREDAMKGVRDLHRRLNDHWKIKISEDLQKNTLQLSGNLDFCHDSKHRLVALVEYLKKRNENIGGVHRVGRSGNIRIPVSKLNLCKNTAAPYADGIPFNFYAHDEQMLWDLYSFECNVLYNLSVESTPHDYLRIGKTFISYLEGAERFHEGDPVGLSRMILVCLKSLWWIDQAVCSSYPLMMEYDTGVPIVIIQHLMLPFKTDLFLAHELETYFSKRKSKSCYPSVIAPYNKFASKHQYSVRHAGTDKKMQEKLKDILEKGEQTAREKLEEVRRMKIEYDELQTKIQGMLCQYTFSRNGRRRHVNPNKCDKCKMKQKASNLKVHIYEKPLPEMVDAQNYIVFELMIPKEIACLRDMLFRFFKHLDMLSTGNRCSTMWPEALREYNLGDLVVSIGRSSLSGIKSYPNSIHVSEPESKFVVENTGDIQLCANKNIIKPLQCIPTEVLKRFVFEVEKGSPYSTLQWVLDDHDFKYSDNEILARQNECPAELSLSEFKEFGSIRAGHRIQLRNLYRALKQGTLSMKAESVLSLICQVLWRAGPPSNDPCLPRYIRESHVDMLNDSFVMEFLALLGSLITQFSLNWDDHHTFAAIIAILLRIFSISNNEEILKNCFVHLQECRKVLLDWCCKIDKVINGLAINSTYDRNKMREKLVSVATLCSWTYWTDNLKSYLVEDVTSWLLSINIIQECIGEQGSAFISSKTVRNKLRRFRECGLNNMTQFQALLSAHPDKLQEFAKAAWSGLFVDIKNNVNWHCHEHYEQLYVAEVSIDGVPMVLQVDILGGLFHINGKPVEYLPEHLCNSDYKRIFGDSKIKIQSLTTSPWSAISKHDFRGAKMLFTKKNVSSAFRDYENLMIITAIYPNGDELEYVPQRQILNESQRLQQFLVKEYTHWWNKKRHIIVFRSMKSHEIEFNLDLKSGLITETATQKCIINNTSLTYCQIVKIFKRLENESCIKIFLRQQVWHTDPEILEVTLPRMRLNFSVEKEGSNLCIRSLEYPGMKVAKVQKCGTLVGLDSGLMLEPVQIGFSNKVLLVPHGFDVKRCDGHVQINTVNLQNPLYFAYEVDCSLLQLKCGQTKSASAYLAYLHALTSYPLPDPFTEHTGTERALQLLQSGHCWSCEPFDKETAATLMLISKLSPKWEYKSKTKLMTTVSWPLSYAISCSDAFQLIVEKLLNDSQRLSVLFDSKLGVEEVDFRGERILSERSYWRSIKCTTEQAHISPKFLTINPPIVNEISKFECSYVSQNMNVVLKLVSLISKWVSAPYSGASLYDSLVRGKSVLSGHLKPFPFQETIVEWQEMEFWDSWLSLYTLAKTVDSKKLKEEWKMIISNFAFRGVSEQHLILLNTIAVFPEKFLDLDPPDCANYEDPKKIVFDQSAVKSIVSSKTSMGFYPFLEKEKLSRQSDDILNFDYNFREEMRSMYNNSLASQVEGITNKMQCAPWPLRSCSAIVDGYVGEHDLLDMKQIKTSVNKLLQNWVYNYELRQFVQKVEERVLELNESYSVIPLDTSDICQKLSCIVTSQIILDEISFIEFNVNEVQGKVIKPSECEEAGIVFQTGKISEAKRSLILSRRKSLVRPSVSRSSYVISSRSYDETNMFTSFNSYNSDDERVSNMSMDSDEEEAYLEERPSVSRSSYVISSRSYDETNMLTSFNSYSSDDERVSNMSMDSDEEEAYLEESVTNKTSIDILSDPDLALGGSTQCKIWEQLVTCLKVGNLTQSSEENRPIIAGNRMHEYQKANLQAKLNNYVKVCEEEQDKYFKLALSMIISDPIISVMITAGSYQRLTPLTLLPIICQEVSTPSHYQIALRNVIGAFGVAETCKKHTLRCLKYLENGNQFELQREMANTPHQNWSPQERPEWLLFEIEMDLAVRPIQKQVAEHMEHPEDGKNAVTQLNMGEGKTAVITPLLVLALTNKKQLCRVTVLKSLFNTNQQTLRTNLGGLLLNRRVYSFPCRRDFPMSHEIVETLSDVYQECVDKRGITITTPEYRLSFQLKAYEQCKIGKHDDATVYLKIQDWLKNNARDILDESDEILQAKYQLVYALGKQKNLVGGSQRWAVLQELLEHVPKVMKDIAANSDNGSVEIIENSSKSGAFPNCRLLKMDIYGKFCALLADGILDGNQFPSLRVHERELLRNFLVEEVIDQGTISSVFEFLPSYSENAFQEKALILRGLMACGVLFITLNKRWRVNYGVAPNGNSLLAVPFRAKDVAAERTEFGHADVALVLTHLSYYYSGLNESQVRECLFRVKQEPNPEMTYKGWIETIKNPDQSILSLHGINVENYVQRNEKLYPALRWNKAVIDFWLGNIVLPIKAKQFPSKMICTAWDLASDQTQLATTGFSGTNDTQLLLPLTIAQKDLPELKRTNFEVVQNLLLKENNSYESLPSGVLSKNILEKLAASNIPLLLDVGALMLDLNNEDVAKKWLELVNKDDKDAAIYFSEKDRLMVTDRSGMDPVPFEISPFRSMLNRCVIYLDDVHTRGTDLKLPAGIKGCVTLGKGVTKDKLVQGCMRLRKLGKGHTVCFWASSEVNNEIKLIAGNKRKFGSANVLTWALNNSRNIMKDGFTHWVAAACNYLSKTTAQNAYDFTDKLDSDRDNLAHKVSIEEVTELKDTYGKPWTPVSLQNVAEQQLQKYCPGVITTVKDKVIKHCETYVPDLKKNVHLLDEEQERELEQEREEEREIERPGSAQPCIPSLDQHMVKFLKTEPKIFDHEVLPEWAMQLPKGLQFTRLADYSEISEWGNGIFITKDFFKTVMMHHQADLIDSYLRPVNWIVSFTGSDSQCWLLISPFEVNELFPMFWSNQVKASLHMYAARTSLQQGTLLELSNLVLPVDTNASLTSVPGFCDLNASLSIFAGCTFFQTMLELESYCAITGYAPKPRSAEEMLALSENLMDNMGFLLPSDRRQMLRPKCNFQNNPERLIVGIITCRYNHFSRLCHVSRLVHESSKPVFDDNDDTQM